MDNVLLTFVIVGFLAVVLLFEGGYLLWNSYRGKEIQRIQRRLQTLSAGGQSSERSKLLKERMLGKTPGAERVLLRVPRVHELDRFLVQSGLEFTVSTYLSVTAMAALSGFMIAVILRQPVLLVLLWTVALASLPTLYVLWARRRRLRTIEEELPDALELMSRAMRAGHSFSSALQMVGSEGPEPIAGEFAAAFDEINYGVPVQEALINLATRVPVMDLRFFVVAVSIQRETGGNLAELLDKLAGLIRARFRLLGQIRVLSTEGRLSAWILSLMPFALAAILFMINPTFMEKLWTDPVGPTLIGWQLFLMVLGILWMRKIIRIRV